MQCVCVCVLPFLDSCTWRSYQLCAVLLPCLALPRLAMDMCCCPKGLTHGALAH